MKANNISDLKTSQSERDRIIDATPNDDILTNSQALRMSLSKQLKNDKRQRRKEF